MKIAIMQPYFFPYLGYFDLIHNVDLFLFYDTVQYIRRGWIHRNRILHQSGNGWQYFIVPTEKIHQKAHIKDVRVLGESTWKERNLSQLAHYNNKTSCAEQIIHFVSDCLMVNELFLSQLNTSILRHCSALLGLNFQYEFCSSLNVELNMNNNAEERILDLCEFLGANEYVNLPGGVNLYHPESFKSRNIKLTFRNLPTFTYSTGPYVFEPNLSIIDLLMWNEPEDIKRYLDNHRNQE